MGKSAKAKQRVTNYYMSVHMGIGSGPFDYLRKITINDKVAWEGLVSAETAIDINQPNLYGGEKEEGGVVGTAWYLPGGPSQVMPEVLANKFGLTSATCPGFRGLASIFFAGAGGPGGFLWSQNSPIVAQSVSMEVERAPKGLDPTKATIGSAGDANPAHIIFEALTNTDWGMGSSTAAIDVESFLVASTTLYNEGFGLSMIWTRQSTIEAFISEVLDHIQATFYLSPRTGLLTLKLLRDDYNESTLRLLTPDNARVTNFQRMLWGETANEIVVTWTNPVNEKEETVSVQDNSNIAAQGEIVSDSRNYYGVRNSSLATTLAQRDLRAAAAPLASMEIEVDRSGWDVLPGEVVKVTWPEYELDSLIMRVGKVDYGKPGSPVVKVALTEDIFSLSHRTDDTSPPSEWVNPGEDPEPMAFTEVLTLPAYFVASTDLQASVLDLTYPDVVAMVLAKPQGSDTSSYELLAETVRPTGEMVFESQGTKTVVERTTLTAALTAQAQSTLSGVILTNANLGPRVNGFVFIGQGGDAGFEIALVSAYSGGNWTLERGVLDTVPKAWPVGTPLWFLNSGTRVADDQDLRSDGELVEYKLLSRTSKGVLAEADAPSVFGTLTGRPHYPNRPANVKINGIGFGSVNVSAATDIAITWATRNRTLEDGMVLRWGDAPIATEYAQQTVVTVKSEAGTTIWQQTGLWTETDLTVPKSYFAKWPRVQVIVSSRRDGFDSLQAHSIWVEGLANNPSAPAPPDPTPATSPPTPVGAPGAGAFTATGGATTDGAGASFPALFVVGTRDNSSATSVIVRFKKSGTSDLIYEAARALDDNSIKIVITAGVVGLTNYDIEIAYVSNNLVGAWRSLGTRQSGASVSNNVVNIGTRTALQLLADVDQALADAAAALAAAGGDAADLSAAIAAAQAARDAAQAAQAAAETARNQAQDAYTAADAAADLATGKADDAALSSTAAQSARDAAQTAQTAAQNAATSATSSATAAAGSATTASQKADAASGSATAAAASATTASTKATEAANSASGAATSASSAAASQTAAGNSASSAATSATNAASSATAANTSAGQALTYASNASTSATNASNSATSAAGSASTASTQATNAANSATAAGNSASSASTSASTATTKATEAANSATSASGSANTATTQATNAASSATAASTSASAAAASATTAGNSASAAQTSAVSATTAAAQTMPSTFENSGAYFVGSAFSPSTALTVDASHTLTSVTGYGIVYQSAAVANVLTKGRVAIGTARTHKLATQQRLTVAASGTNYIQLGWALYNASDVYIGYYIPSFTTITTADNWKAATLSSLSETIKSTATYSGSYTSADAVYIRGWTVVPQASGATTWVSFLRYEDITESTAAASSATAAATSASSAAASQTAAGNSASAAQTSATNAATSATNSATSATQASTSATNASGSASTAATQATNAANSATAAGNSASSASTSASTATTKASEAATSATSASTSANNASVSAGNASTSATSASTSAAAASASAAAAQSSATLAASVGLNALNKSPSFADNVNTTGVPTNWSAFGNGANGYRVTGLVSPYGFRLPSTTSDIAGLFQAGNALAATSAAYYVLEAVVTLKSGTLVGAGLLVQAFSDQSFSTQVGTAMLTLATDEAAGVVVGNGEVDKTYRFSKLVNLSTATGMVASRLFLASHWSVFGSTAAANDITWHTGLIRAATSQEIAAGRADTNASTALAQIATNQSTQAGVNTTQATTNTSLQAQINTNATNISNEITARTTADTSLGNSITSLTSTVSGNTASLTTQAATLADITGKFYSRYMLELNANGVVTGIYATAAQGTGGTSTSGIKLRANTFAIVPSDDSATLYPFIYDATKGTLVLKDVIAESANIGALAVKTLNLDGEAVTTEKLRNNSVTNNVTVSSSATSGNINVAGEQNVTSLVIENSGGRIEIMAAIDLQIDNTGTSFQARVYRDGTLIRQGGMTQFLFSRVFPVSDNPGPGTHTYEIRINRTNSAGGAAYITYYYLSATEVKK